MAEITEVMKCACALASAELARPATLLHTPGALGGEAHHLDPNLLDAAKPAHIASSSITERGSLNLTTFAVTAARSQSAPLILPGDFEAGVCPSRHAVVSHKRLASLKAKERAG